MVEDEPDAGSVVNDRFELLEPLGSGGFARVWRASDRDRNEAVALKVGRTAIHDDDRIRATFQREVHWARRFSTGPTPGSLVQFLDGSLGGRCPYVAIELIEGNDVAEGLDSASVDPGVDALGALGLPVVRAVAFLHDAGVAHLDVKPANVLVRETGVPALIDLNAAIAREAGAETETLFHHEPWKPPELSPTDAREEPVGAAADVYGLGAYCAALLVGTDAPVGFEADAVSDWGPIDLAERDCDVSDTLVDAVEMATRPNPARRFATAGAFFRALLSTPELGGEGQVGYVETRKKTRRIAIRPDEAVGRWTPGESTPAVVVPDEEAFLSPEHARFERDEGSEWTVRDESLNGTHVGREVDESDADGPVEWTFVLSDGGLARRREAGRPPETTDAPPDGIDLSDGDLIAPVDPDYGVRLRWCDE